MDYKKYFIFISVTLGLTQAVKVNMQGTISLGKDVLASINQYLRRSLNTRRSGSSDTDINQLLIKSAYLCRDLDICTNPLETFVEDYLLFLAKAIEAVFQTAHQPYRLFSEDEFKIILAEIRNLLRNATLKINEDNNWLMWIELLKQISGHFELAAINFTAAKLASPGENEKREELNSKYVTALAIVEGRYETKLCSEHQICVKSIECTKALDNLFTSLNNLDENKVKLFVRAVAEALVESNFDSVLGETTATDLQIVLTDMAYSDDVRAKTVLSSVHKGVSQRLSNVEAKKYSTAGRDILLLNSILSDVDFAYSFRKMDPFHVFFSNFFGWVRTGMKLSNTVKQVMNDIKDQLSMLPAEVLKKLQNEVKTFLEITVAE